MAIQISEEGLRTYSVYITPSHDYISTTCPACFDAFIRSLVQQYAPTYKHRQKPVVALTDDIDKLSEYIFQPPEVEQERENSETMDEAESALNNVD